MPPTLTRKSALTRRGADCLAQWLTDRNIPAQPREHEDGSWSVLCGITLEHFWSRREAEAWLKGPTLTLARMKREAATPKCDPQAEGNTAEG